MDIPNKFRTLLLNAPRYPVLTPYAQYIDPDFAAISLTPPLENIRRALMFHGTGRAASEFLATMLCKIAWGHRTTRALMIHSDARTSFDLDRPQLDRVRPKVTLELLDDAGDGDIGIRGEPGLIPDGFHRRYVLAQGGIDSGVLVDYANGGTVPSGIYNEANTQEELNRVDVYSMPDTGIFTTPLPGSEPGIDATWTISDDLGSGFELFKNTDNEGFVVAVEIFQAPSYTADNIAARLKTVGEQLRTEAVRLGNTNLTAGISSDDPSVVIASAVTIYCLAAGAL